MAIEITSETLAGAQPEPQAGYKEGPRSAVSDFSRRSRRSAGRTVGEHVPENAAGRYTVVKPPSSLALYPVSTRRQSGSVLATTQSAPRPEALCWRGSYTWLLIQGETL